MGSSSSDEDLLSSTVIFSSAISFVGAVDGMSIDVECVDVLVIFRSKYEVGDDCFPSTIELSRNDNRGGVFGVLAIGDVGGVVTEDASEAWGL